MVKQFPLRVAILSLVIIKDIAFKQEIHAVAHELPLLRKSHGEHNVLSHDTDTGEPLYAETGKYMDIQNAAIEQERLIKRFGDEAYRTVYADIDDLRAVLLKNGVDVADDEQEPDDEPKTAKELKAAIMALGGVVAGGAKLADLQAQYAAMTVSDSGADGLAPTED